MSLGIGIGSLVLGYVASTETKAHVAVNVVEDFMCDFKGTGIFNDYSPYSARRNPPGNGVSYPQQLRNRKGKSH